MSYDRIVKKHKLSILVEKELHYKLRILPENGEDEEKKMEIIQDFIDKIPDEFKELDNYKQIIEGTLYRLEQEEKEEEER